ncbi:MAG: hypothetical protein IZT59_09895 [Verrucomicrobia bacterium]|nr:hypothetical protein [Verrucomicrobiota bacterium]
MERDAQIKAMKYEVPARADTPHPEKVKRTALLLLLALLIAPHAAIHADPAGKPASPCPSTRPSKIGRG